MTQVKDLFESKYLEIVLRNLNYSIEDGFLSFFQKPGDQETIIYNGHKNQWSFIEEYLYSSGERRSQYNFATLEELIKEKIVPYFYQVPDEHVKNIFTLWTQGWSLETSDAENKVSILFRKDLNYFYYPLLTRELQHGYTSTLYVKVSPYTSIELFNKSCWNNGKYCSKDYFFKDILENKYYKY